MLDGRIIRSMSFASGSERIPTQSAVVTSDCANFWFCGTVQASPTVASCNRGAHWVRGTTKSLPPAPPPPGPPPPPPPPGNSVQEFNQFGTSSCEGTTVLHGTWRYRRCSSLYPSLIPPNITSSVGSTRATLGGAPHSTVTFELFSDENCTTPLSSWNSTLTVNLNICTESDEPTGTYSLFHGHKLPAKEH